MPVYVCISFVTFEHPLYSYIFLHRGRFVYCPFLLVRFIADEPFFFLNRDGNRLSEQSVRRIINRYADLSNQPGHYTPHMFRHSFATYLWVACGDVYEVKEILGHSSIKTTERYVHASFERQKKVLSSMHPRATLKFTY